MPFSAALPLAVSLTVLAFSAPLAFAQEQPSAISKLTEVIAVNARKKAGVENVQDVPVSIAAYSAGTIEALKVRTLQDLSFSAPNVALEDIGTSPGIANSSIRGLGINSSIPSIDPTVGVFVDGVYIGVNNGVVFDVFDLESVEVLRGPQGLLFGRNTTGGAVLVNTADPTDTLSIKARASVDGPVDSGRGGNNYILQAALSGPLVEGKLNGKIAAYYRDDTGYFRNLFDGSKQGVSETVVLRGALEFLPTDRVRMLAKIEYFDSDGDGAVGQNRGTFSRDSFDLSLDNDGFYDVETILGSWRTDIDVDFGEGTITNIFGYRDFSTSTFNDIDALPVTIFDSNTALEQEQISNELRYNGVFGAFDVTTGVFFFNQDVAYDEDRILPSAVFFGGGRQDHTVIGLFAQTDWEATDALTLTFGLRWSYEEKDAAVSYVLPRAQCSVVAGTCPTSGADPLNPAQNNGFEDEDSWSNFTPKIAAQYQFTDGQVYASWTRGFRSGGYNFRITAPEAFEAFVAQQGQFAFDEERVDAFELGAKYTTPDSRGRLNGAFFYMDIANMQREVNASSGETGIVQTILNTADARILGLELEGQYAVTDALLLSANVGWIDAQYTDIFFDISGDGAITAADDALAIPRVPEITFGFGAVYDLDLGDKGNIITRITYQYRDRIAYTDNNFGWIQSANMLDFNVAYQTPVEGLTASIYGRNMLDQVQAGGDTQTPFGGPLSNGVSVPFDNFPAGGSFSPLNRGRTLGLELRYAYQ
ncbi:MAG: TonB-dependent receptor [Pseudomonadota bacterium]